MQLNLTAKQNAYKQACISLQSKGGPSNWNTGKYFMELIFLTIKHQQMGLKLKKIPKTFLSMLNFLRQIELIVIQEQHLQSRVDIKEGYDAYIDFTNNYTILHYEWSLLNKEFLCIDSAIIKELYNEYKKRKDVIVYGIRINPQKTDIFGGFTSCLENITQNINNSNFKQYDRINQISGVFVINKTIKKNKCISLLPKHIVFKTRKINKNDNNIGNYGNQSTNNRNNKLFDTNIDNTRMNNDENKICFNDERLFMNKIGIDHKELNKKYDMQKIAALEQKIKLSRTQNQKYWNKTKNELEQRLSLLETAIGIMESSNSNTNEL